MLYMPTPHSDHNHVEYLYTMSAIITTTIAITTTTSSPSPGRHKRDLVLLHLPICHTRQLGFLQP